MDDNKKAFSRFKFGDFFFHLQFLGWKTTL